MNILQIIQSDQRRGAELFACELSTHLKAKGHQVDVLILFGERTGSLNFDLKFHYLNANKTSRWFDVDAFKRLAQIIKEGKYDLVQANAGDTLKYAVLSKLLFHWKSVLVFRNANKISGFLRSKLKKYINGLMLRKVQFVVSVSEECRTDFINTFHFPSKNIVTIPIGVETHLLTPYTTINDIGINTKGPILIHAASFVPEKNHAGLLRIFKQINNHVPESILLLLGAGPLENEVKQLAENMGLTDSVFFLGNRKDIRQILPIGNVFLLPSLIEGLPAVILEAFISKIPVVAYDTGGIKEIVIDQETGYLIEQGNENSFAESVLFCIANDNSSIKNNALKLVNSNYSHSVISARFELFYKQISRLA